MKPILFNTYMVRAILAGNKTVTRRVVKPQPMSKLAYACMGYKHGTWGYPGADNWKYWEDESFRLPDDLSDKERNRHWTPPYRHGDILYVRETFFKYADEYIYKASAAQPELWNGMWRPSIHMPREAARIFLRVTSVRVERLQGIDDAGAKAEGANWRNGKNVGFEEKMRRSSIDRFAEIWDSTIKPADRARYGWEANPWVWVIEFERCRRPEGNPDD